MIFEVNEYISAFMPIKPQRKRLTMRKTIIIVSMFFSTGLLCLGGHVLAQSEGFRGSVYDMGRLKPIDSELKVKTGQPAPMPARTQGGRDELSRDRCL